MKEMLLWFLNLIQNFPVKLVVIELMLCWGLPKRKCFALRLLLPCVTALVFCTQFSSVMPWRDYGGFSHWPPFWIGSYFNAGLLIVFALSCIAVYACFRVSLDWLLLYCISGYIIQNLGYQLVEAFRYEVFGMESTVEYMLISTVVNAAVFLVSSLYFRRFYEKCSGVHAGRQYVLAYTTISLMLVAEFSQLITKEVRRIPYFHLYAALCCFLLLVIQVSVFRKGSADLEKAKLEEIIQKMKWHQEYNSINVEALNRKCHDLKHEISALRNLPRSEREVNITELEQALELYDNMYLTGCKPLDTLLMEERLQCDAHHIELNCIVDGTALSFISPVDIHILFGNALDNAIEAEKNEEEGKRVISLSVRRRGDMVVIALDNYFSHKLAIDNGMIQTSKQDKENHGYGIKSMKLIVERYKGHITFSAQNEYFRTVILLPVNQSTAA